MDSDGQKKSELHVSGSGNLLSLHIFPDYGIFPSIGLFRQPKQTQYLRSLFLFERRESDDNEKNLAERRRHPQAVV